jgi:hypothetical protein
MILSRIFPVVLASMDKAPVSFSWSLIKVRPGLHDWPENITGRNNVKLAATLSREARLVKQCHACHTCWAVIGSQSDSLVSEEKHIACSKC